MEELITIELFGQTFTFKTEAEILRARKIADALVEEVNRVASQQSEATSEMNKITTMILASLNIANEKIELKDEYHDFMNTISELSTTLIKNLDDCIVNSQHLLCS